MTAEITVNTLLSKETTKNRDLLERLESMNFLENLHLLVMVASHSKIYVTQPLPVGYRHCLLELKFCL